jgi:hypothetical protein
MSHNRKHGGALTAAGAFIEAGLAGVGGRRIGLLRIIAEPYEVKDASIALF